MNTGNSSHIFSNQTYLVRSPHKKRVKTNYSKSFKMLKFLGKSHFVRNQLDFVCLYVCVCGTKMINNMLRISLT